MVRAILSATGVFIPEPVITNAELVAGYNAWVAKAALEPEKWPGYDLRPSDVDFIVKASSIEQRHVIEKTGILDPERMVPRISERRDDELSVQAEFALQSARQAIQAAGIEPSDIDMVICSCAHHQRPYPAIAVEVQHALGAGGAAFDMNMACSASTFAMIMAVSLVESGMARHVLVTSPEIMSGHLNWRDRETHFIFGDASASIVISAEDAAPAGQGFRVVTTGTETQFSSNIRSNFGFLNRTHAQTANAKDKLVTQAGNRVFREVTLAAGNFIAQFIAKNGFVPGDIKRFWVHQANKRMNAALIGKVLGHPPSEDEMPLVLHKYGNTAAPGSVIAFHENHGDFNTGDTGVLCSYGAGYSIGGLILEKR
jgi:beta-ketodecanoyl-[acyl-carrier-protein] synthase